MEPSNPSKVKVYGPGVEKGVKTNQPTYFTVDCQGAGSGKLVFEIFSNLLINYFLLFYLFFFLSLLRSNLFFYSLEIYS